MEHIVHKVTCFITQHVKHDTKLLLFVHPNAGVQIPAGTVNSGEEPERAAWREATEESGLTALKLVRYLGEQADPPPTGYTVVAYPTIVFGRPDLHSYDWAHFRIGLPVEVLRHVEGFTQVRYEEKDNYFESQYPLYSITGWLPDDALTDQRVRHFYLFEATAETPPRWSVSTDYHTFELFWAPLDNLPAIVPPQDTWVQWLAGL